MGSLKEANNTTERLTLFALSLVMAVASVGHATATPRPGAAATAGSGYGVCVLHMWQIDLTCRETTQMHRIGAPIWCATSFGRFGRRKAGILWSTQVLARLRLAMLALSPA